jgi:hypothetical protein
MNAQFAGGDGSKETPYIITTAEQLSKIGSNSGNENKYFELGDNIDLADWIANNSDPDIQEKGWKAPDSFRKVFDGKGKTISGLWINRPSESVGLFFRDLAYTEPQGLMQAMKLMELIM